MENMDSFSTLLSQTHSRLADDTVYYSIFPDSTLSAAELQSLHNAIVATISPFTANYIWQHSPFTLLFSNQPIPHLYGHLRFGDNLEDEWFVVFLLFHISSTFPTLSIQAYDSDGEFLLIESAFHLPRWITPENSCNRVFIRGGKLHIIPKTLRDPVVTDSLKLLINHENETVANEAIQEAVKRKLEGFPERAERNVMRVRVRVPVKVAQVLRYEPGLIGLAVEGFYDRDVDMMKYAARMERFLVEGEKELVCVMVRMSRVMYAQLIGQRFQAPRGYPMPSVQRIGGEEFKEAELGLKIACGLEMMYWDRKRRGEDVKGGAAWERYKEGLERCGYFEGLLPGSKEYKRLTENADECFKKSALFSKESEALSAPVRRIDEILALPHSADDFKGQEVPPSDDDSWLYGGEEELNSALSERQKEMDIYNAKHKQKQHQAEQPDAGASSSGNVGDFDLGDITNSMKAFVDKVSSYEGAEAPEDRNLREVDFDVDRFMKDMEYAMRDQRVEDNADDDSEGSLSEMDFDDSEDEGDSKEPSACKDGKEETFMHSYSDVLSQELRNTTLKKSFVHASEDSSKKDEEPSNAAEDVDEDFTPVDVDFNLVKSFLDSFSSQQGLPGPASNLLGLMGVQLPKDANKDK